MSKRCGCHWEPIGNGGKGYNVYCAEHIHAGGPLRGGDDG